MSKILLKGGTVVSGSSVKKADVLIEDEKIKAVGTDLSGEKGSKTCPCPYREGSETASDQLVGSEYVKCNRGGDFNGTGKCHVTKEDLSGAEVIDVTGKLIFPGFIDTHTHFQMQASDCVTADDFDSGTRAALAGGTTCILDFTTQSKGKTLIAALDHWHEMADGHCSCDYSFHMSITDWNPDIKSEIPVMTREGVTSYKVYMAYPNLRITDHEIFEILQAVAQEGGIVGTHCENGDLIVALTASLRARGLTSPSAHPIAHSREVESEAVNRYLTIAHEAGTPVNIVHLSTKQSMDFVRMARDKGQIVCVETCPQYFFLDDSMYDLPDFEGAKYVFSPPARKKEDQDALWDAIRHGEVDTIGTDHCSFNFATEKILGIDDFASIPNGIPGTEHRPVLMYTYGVLKGRMTNQAFCRLLSENAAKQFGMYPQKGAIQEGSDADIVVWDPNCAGVITAEKQIQAVDYTPYEGMEIKGAPSLVFLHGQLAAKDGQVVRKGLGRYVSRKAADLSFRKN